MVPVPFRPYVEKDLDACLRVFDSNVPEYFAAEERAEFAAHLAQVDGLARHYIVLEGQGRICACGGVTCEDGMARLTWGAVARDWQGRGLGTRLVTERLAGLASLPAIRHVALSTGTKTVGFYARFGFRVVRKVQDGFAPGLECWDMELAMHGRAG